MTASITFDQGKFTMKNKPEFRAQPEKEYAHRLQTRAHLKYLEDEKPYDVTDPRWAKKTDSNGQVSYAHAYQDSLLILTLQSADGKLDLRHNEDGSFDRYLKDNPGEHVVYTLVSVNSGSESQHIFQPQVVALSSVAIIMAGLAMTVLLANGVMAASAAVEAGGIVAAFIGGEVSVIPAVGIVVAVLALIGLWLAYELGVEIAVGLSFENRSLTRTLQLVDTYTSAHDIYNACTTGDLVTGDFVWGTDLVVKNCVDPKGFEQYSFSGIYSFNDL